MKRGVDYIGIGTGAMIFNKQGEVLIAQRGPEAKNEVGKWDFPGGSVEFGETCEQAVKREIKEEFNIDIEIIKLLLLIDHIIPEEHQHWVSPSFLAKLIGGEIKNLEPTKNSAVKWVKLEAIDPKTLTYPSKSDFEKYIKEYGFQPPKL